MGYTPVESFKTLSFDVVDIDKDNGFAKQAKSQGIKFKPDDRIFKSIVQASIVDRQGDQIDHADFLRAMGDWKTNGAVLRYNHFPQTVVGHGMMYKRVGFKSKDGNIIDGIEYIGKINKGSSGELGKLEDMVWDGIQNGTIKGSSFGGTHTINKSTMVRNNQGGVNLYATGMVVKEISLCNEPVNQFALIMDHNEMAKSLTNEDYDRMNIDMVKGLDGRDYGRITCNSIRCYGRTMKKSMNKNDHSRRGIKYNYGMSKGNMDDMDHTNDSEEEISEMKKENKKMSKAMRKSLDEIEERFDTYDDRMESVEKSIGSVDDKIGVIAKGVAHLMEKSEEAVEEKKEEKKVEDEKSDDADGDKKIDKVAEKVVDEKSEDSDKDDDDKEDVEKSVQTGNGTKGHEKLPAQGAEENDATKGDPKKGTVGGSVGELTKSIDDNGNLTFTTPPVSVAMEKAMSNTPEGGADIWDKMNKGTLQKSEVQGFNDIIRNGSLLPKMTEDELVKAGFGNTGGLF